jgi:SAM-dependent methyltransferase
MALMLNALHVQDTHRVLEIGTGTGYNTALLCHRVGASNVTSIDIDAGLVTRARNILAALGYRPYLAPIDGIQGCAEQAPFERIIATVAVDRVPEAWLDQATLGATLLCPLDLMARAGLLVSLTIGPNKTAEGWLLPDIGAFMGVRANHHDTLAIMSDIDDNDGDQRKTSLPVDQTIRTNSPFEFFGALITGGYDWLGFTPSNGGPVENWLTQPNGTWVCHTIDASGNMIVRQGGPIRLWDRIEHAYQQWQELGEPVRERFGLTVRDGQHTIWLDSPGGANQWELETY